MVKTETVEVEEVIETQNGATPRKSKRERFLELAPKRVDQVTSALGRLENCSNRSGYEYTENEVNLMFTAILEAYNGALRSFQSKSGKQDEAGFRF